MKIDPEIHCPKIIDEVTFVPFLSFGVQYQLSAFKIELTGNIFECMCLHHGDLADENFDEIPVRIHSGCITSEVFGSQRCDCAWQLRHSLQYIADSGKGFLVYLPWQEGRSNGLVQKIKTFPHMDIGMTTCNAFNALGLPVDNRDYTPAVAVLFRFGLTRIQLITNNPNKISAMQANGIEVAKRIPSVMKTEDPYILEYLDSKAHQLGHLI